MKLTIGWLYPNLMGTYGDRGNILVLTKRCLWRGIDFEVNEINIGGDLEKLSSCNLIFMGGAQDRQQKIVSDDVLKRTGPVLKELVEKGIPGLFVCASYQFMGNYYKTADGVELTGLGLFDLHTVSSGESVSRCIGNITIELNFSKLIAEAEINKAIIPKTLVGFENHGGRTYLGSKVNPLGKVIKGFGNNGKDFTEGAIYKNAVGCYFHGPCLPRNPHLADILISRALKLNIYDLKQLDDSLEYSAHEEGINR